MRVLHLTTSSVGGAAIAAQRLHSAMRDQGIDSYLLSRGPRVGLDGESALTLTPLDRMRSSATTLGCGAAARNTHVFFSPWSLGFVDRSVVEEFAPDAIIVHNWFNLLGVRGHGLLTDLGIPIVFTMHDERLFTGGCHHAGTCRGFEQLCSRCPQARLLAQPAIARGHRAIRMQLQRGRVTAVGPSQWIVDAARASASLAGVQVNRIPNVVDTETFTPERRAAARATMGIAEDVTVLAWQPGKGDELLAPVIKRLMSQAVSGSPVLLQTSGPAVAGIPTLTAGTLRTEAQRANFWAAADVAFSLTEFDNFPNITLEAMACGVPFVAPRVGGAAEAIDEVGGGLVAARSAEAIADALTSLVESPMLRGQLGARGRYGVARLYSKQRVVADYVTCISDML